MLKKIVSIKNVGRFKKHDAVGDVELKRYNLIFAENGRGKTTLCAILRSLQTGDAAHVLGRTTLGSNDAPEIRILSDAGMLNFTSGAWNQAMPELAIFDSTFVSENVFSGDYVDLDHKRSLYRVIIGKEGVELAKKIDDCDTASRDKASEISAKAASIQLEIPKGVTVETFLSLDNDADVDQKIIAKEKELEAVKRADQIKTRTALSAISMPVIPAGFSHLLAKTIDDIDADIEQRVADQIQAHAMHARGETWLLEGLGYVRDDKCPFCSQNLGTGGAFAGRIQNLLQPGL
jgi:wobble nucleotide-excising tRNase